MHSANTNTARPPRDALASLRFSRKHGKATLRRIRQQGLAKTDNGFDPYLNVKRRAIGDRRPLAQLRMIEAAIGCDVTRSEEHTSELQSLMRISYAVFCLKKKNTQNTEDITHKTQ